MGLPRKHNLEQWKKAKAKAGKDIGEQTEKIGGKDANLVHIDNATDRKISTYEDFISNKEGYAPWDMGKKSKKTYEYHESENVWDDEELEEKEKAKKAKKCTCGKGKKCTCGKGKGKVKESLNMNLQEAPSAKETKSKIKLFDGGTMGPTGNPLYGEPNQRQTINPANRALDLLRIGKQVSFNGWEGFIDKVENGKVFVRERVGGKLISMKLAEFFRKMKINESIEFKDIVRTEGNPDGIDPELLYDHDILDEEELETDDELPYEPVNELEDEVEEEITENLLPKPCPQVQCLECGEWVDDYRNKKIRHLQIDHNIKPDVDDYRIKQALKDYFTSY